MVVDGCPLKVRTRFVLGRIEAPAAAIAICAAPMTSGAELVSFDNRTRTLLPPILMPTV